LDALDQQRDPKMVLDLASHSLKNSNVGSAFWLAVNLY